MAEPQKLSGPDLSEGVALDTLTDGEPLLGHAGGEPVLLTLLDGEVYAIGAACTHYGGPLGEGLAHRGTVRCPWHHACFSLRTGEPIGPPALSDLPRWRTEQRDGRVFVTEKLEAAKQLEPRARQGAASKSAPGSVLIIGGGAAGAVAAETLRREGYAGEVTIVDADADATVDRPNLSKDYLAGSAPEEWMPLRPAEFYETNGITRMLGRRVVGLDAAGRRVELDGGETLDYGALLLAPGAEPVRLPDDVVRDDAVHYLRTLADCRAIIDDAGDAKRAVVLGASFIGLEVAASLRARDLEVHIVAPEDIPLARVLGKELGAFVKDVHEKHGVVFHLGRIAASVGLDGVVLDDGTQLAADLVVAGIGVRPRTALAEQAGLTIDNGIAVDERLRTSARHIWAAGDAASFPDARTGERIRVEHWVHAERMGRDAALSILDALDRFRDPPFFWSRHHDVTIAYVGHATSWDQVEIDGDIAERDAAVRFVRGGQVLALATIERGLESLKMAAAWQDAR